jgi:hypothetical protein
VIRVIVGEETCESVAKAEFTDEAMDVIVSSVTEFCELQCPF